MARTKRKVNPLTSVPDEPVMPQRTYKTGAYIRLSVEDSGKPGADTIEAQKELVLGYIDTQTDMQFCGLYCDNGRTGTNFQRPEFDRLMEDIRAGKIDCIVVKDLSRFGRNYKETGNYLERIFPYLDVRFVAVNDNFDTLTAERTNDGYIVPLKNLINEIYSRDISKKSSSALAIKQQRGEFIGSWAPYGYRKSAEDRHRLEPDPETAPVLKNIFQWRLSGMGYLPIARHLNEMGIPSPSRLHYLRGEIKSERFASSVWHVPILKIILRNEVYLGHTIQGRTKNDIAAGRKMCPVSQDDWVIVRNTHEPLIDEKTFHKVREIGESRRTEHNEKCGKFDSLGTTPNILKGLVYCAECGRTMSRYKAVSERCGHRYYTYICRTHMENPSACPKRNLHETVLIEMLWDCLRREMVLAGGMADQVRKYARSPAVIDRKGELDRSLSSAKQALSRYKRLYDSLYQNYVDGLMDELEYAEMKRQYQAEAERAQAQAEQLERQIADISAQTSSNPWLQNFTRFAGETELTDDMAHALIQRIEVDKNENITLHLKYRDEYAKLAALLNSEATL